MCSDGTPTVSLWCDMQPQPGCKSMKKFLVVGGTLYSNKHGEQDSSLTAMSICMHVSGWHTNNIFVMWHATKAGMQGKEDFSCSGWPAFIATSTECKGNKHGEHAEQDSSLTAKSVCMHVSGWYTNSIFVMLHATKVGMHGKEEFIYRGWAAL